SSPYLASLDCFCNGQYVTTVQADGLIIATPTGSTAYSMSAGGSMMHPGIQALLLTPICPHSLSFRPLVFPDSAVISLCMPLDVRSHAWVSFDGRFRHRLMDGDILEVGVELRVPPTHRDAPQRDSRLV
ncbi:NAD+ kinase, partial [Nannochloropsis gaditana CCMP526]|uniref:NAD+ kinase n=1 Tax=Nannochloropsis gaditana (strain CCMP526) TaxID=1093141 RepID=UPI00029F580A